MSLELKTVDELIAEFRNPIDGSWRTCPSYEVLNELIRRANLAGEYEEKLNQLDMLLPCDLDDILD